MKNLFTRECLQISVRRNNESNILVSIESDFSGSDRKSELYVNEDRLATEVEDFWKGTKTKKLLSMSVSFFEIDWYDDMTDIYETPIIRIERGLKKARIRHQEHGSIPKDWGVAASFKFADTTTNTPLLEVVERALGSYFDAEAKKKFVKELKPFLQKKDNSAYINLEREYNY